MDIEDYKVSNLTVHDIYRQNEEHIYDEFIKDIICNIDTIEWKTLMKMMKKKYHIAPSTVSMNYTYYKLVSRGEIKPCTIFEKYVVGKLCRTNSGITQITVLSSPYPNGQAFSCEHNCYYCPNEPPHEGNNFQQQPRSYLYKEPAVRRANQNNFDGAEQMWDRMSTLLLCGLPIDKLEVMVLGGTWGSYPEDYREEFIRDLYYAVNTFYIDKNKRPDRLSLESEIELNMIATVRIIGLTLETRPDHVTANEIMLFRKYNCTRVQIGVQHTDDKILKKINRGCYTEDTIRAIRNLLDVGLKVDVHLMFDLPYASPDDDKKMIDMMLNDENLRFDQAKFYPFSSLDWTVTKQWEDKGENLHYSKEELMDVLIYAKSIVHPWIRLNRVIRDIPSDYITAGNDVPNLRQEVLEIMKKNGLTCRCIRCREIKNKKEPIENINKAQLFIRHYRASDGDEFFISIESPDNKYIYGFCRLRLSPNMGYITDIKPRIKRITPEDNNENYINVFPYLNGCAMIRELHIYGNMVPVNSNEHNTQHRGFGKMLVKKAEEIATFYNYKKMAIISGVGVRNYYEKLGYTLYDTYMIKNLNNTNHIYIILFMVLFMVLFNIIRIFL
jgi:ELP3 family radical SAM enzyme/protein acetyltransferase